MDKMALIEFALLVGFIGLLAFGAMLFKVQNWIDRTELTIVEMRSDIRLGARGREFLASEAAHLRHRMDSLETSDCSAAISAADPVIGSGEFFCLPSGPVSYGESAGG